MRRPRDNVVVHGSDPAPRIRSPASDRRIRSPDGTFDNERGPTIRNLAAFPAKAGRFPPGEAGSNERGELQSIVPIASSAPLRRESRRRALKRHGPDPGPPLSRPDELPASGGMRAAGLLGATPPPPGGGRGGDLQPRWAISSPWTVCPTRRWTSDGISDLQVPGLSGLGPPSGGRGGVSELRTRPCARDSPRSAVGRRLDDGRRGTQARSSSRSRDGRGPHLQIPELSPRFREESGGSRSIRLGSGQFGSFTK